MDAEARFASRAAVPTPRACSRFRKEGPGYLAIQNSRPQTIGYGLVDSPLLQLAWIAEKVNEWTDLPVDRDQLLTTVSLY